MLTLWHAEVPCYVVCMRFGIFLVSFNHVYDTLEFRGLISRRVFCIWESRSVVLQCLLTLWLAELPFYVVVMTFWIFLVSFHSVYDTLEFRVVILLRVGMQKCGFMSCLCHSDLLGVGSECVYGFGVPRFHFTTCFCICESLIVISLHIIDFHVSFSLCVWHFGISRCHFTTWV